jgi:hypothetical protein
MDEKESRPAPGGNLPPGTVYLAAAFVAAAALVAFLPSLGNEFVLWDDNILIYDNPMIRSLDFGFFKWAFSSRVLGSWYPLTLVSFALDYAVWGPGPWGFHLTNVLLHSANAFLVTLVVIRLVETGKGRKGAMDRTALVAGVVTALLFALHPLRVESVVWVTERKDVLYGLFYLLSLLAYLRYARRTSPGRVYYAVALVLFAMSLMSKPMAVTLPAVLLILDFYPLKRLSREGGLRGTIWVVVEKVPFFVLSLSVSVVTSWSHYRSGLVGSFELDRPLLFFFRPVRACMFYLYKMVLPLNLNPMYTVQYNLNPETLQREYNFVSFDYLGSLFLLSAVMLRFYPRSLPSPMQPTVLRIWRASGLSYSWGSLRERPLRSPRTGAKRGLPSPPPLSSPPYLWP